MLASGLKLFGFLTLIVVYAFIDKEHIVAFAVNFLLLYFVYTAFEVAISFKKFGAQAKIENAVKQRVFFFTHFSVTTILNDL